MTTLVKHGTALFPCPGDWIDPRSQAHSQHLLSPRLRQDHHSLSRTEHGHRHGMNSRKTASTGPCSWRICGKDFRETCQPPPGVVMSVSNVRSYVHESLRPQAVLRAVVSSYKQSSPAENNELRLNGCRFQNCELSTDASFISQRLFFSPVNDTSNASTRSSYEAGPYDQTKVSSRLGRERVSLSCQAAQDDSRMTTFFGVGSGYEKATSREQSSRPLLPAVKDDFLTNVHSPTDTPVGGVSLQNSERQEGNQTGDSYSFGCGSVSLLSSGYVQPVVSDQHLLFSTGHDASRGTVVISPNSRTAARSCKSPGSCLAVCRSAPASCGARDVSVVDNHAKRAINSRSILCSSQSQPCDNTNESYFHTCHPLVPYEPRDNIASPFISPSASDTSTASIPLASSINSIFLLDVHQGSKNGNNDTKLPDNSVITSSETLATPPLLPASHRRHSAALLPWKGLSAVIGLPYIPDDIVWVRRRCHRRRSCARSRSIVEFDMFCETEMRKMSTSVSPTDQKLVPYVPIRYARRMGCSLLSCINGSPYLLDEKEVRAVAHLSYISQWPYEPSNPLHEQLLHRYWSAGQDAVTIQQQADENTGVQHQRFSWLKLGFQGPNPRTDFRGGGILSLACMVYFAEQHNNEFLHIVNEADHLGSYPFSAAFINVALMLIVCFQLKPNAVQCPSGHHPTLSRKAFKFFARLLCDARQHAFEELFSCCCISMHRHWRQLSHQSTLLDFQRTLRYTQKRLIQVLESSPTQSVDFRKIYMGSST